MPPPRSRRIGPVSRCAKCRRYCRLVTTFLFSHVGLCGLVVGYSIVGAFTFEALEAGYELRKREIMLKERQNVVNDLWNITSSSKILSETNWTVLANEALQDFEVTLVRAVRKEGYDGKDESPLQWTFSGALLYSIIVITTIGYGNIAPKTAWGKVVTIFYAIIGIPLLLLCLSNIGDAMAHSFRFIYWKVCCYFCVRPKKRRKKHRHSSGYRVPPSPLPPPPPRPILRTSARNNIGKPHQVVNSPHSSTGLSPSSSYCTAPSTNEELRSSPSLTSPHSSPRMSRHDDASPTKFCPPSIPSYEAVVADGLSGSQSYQHTPPVFQDCSTDLILGPVIPNRYVLQSDCDILVDSNSSSNPVPKTTVYSIRTDQNKGGHYYPPITPTPCSMKSAANSFVWKHETRRLDLDIDLTTDESRDDLSSDDGEEEVDVPMWLCLALVVSYICGGAVLFTFWEKWNFLDSSYFCFVTLTTIGFGDLVPGTAVISDDNQLTLGLCSLYLLFGMALLAMSFNLVQEEVTRSVRCIGQRIGIVSDDEED